MKLKKGDVVRVADWTHLHLDKAFHGKLEVVYPNSGDSSVGVRPLPPKKKAANVFHVDDTFEEGEDIEFLDPKVLERTR